METLKKTDNLTFTANYADGEKRNIEEGILFEFEDEKITLHMGTNRMECLFSIMEATLEAIEAFGLGEEFHTYLEMNRGEQPEVEVVQ